MATMETFSLEIEVEAPFVSDFMTVCSERQGEFWRAGRRFGGAHRGDPDSRDLDVYASASAPREASPRRVLYLTYALDAYVPGAGRGKGLRTWESLRDATETALIEQVRSGACELTVKCHPQQDRRVEAVRLARLAGSDYSRAITIADEDADTRELILGCDVVVGFQTTALYEAVAARRTVIYAAWGDEYERHRDGLIAFDTAPSGCVLHATSPESLKTMIDGGTPANSSECIAWSEEALGTLDGKATERVARRLEAMAGAWSATERRHELDTRRRRYALGYLARSVAAETVWTVAAPVMAVCIAAGEQRRVGVRRKRAREARATAVATLPQRKTRPPIP